MSRAPFAIRRHLLVKKTTAIPNDPGTLLLRLGYRLGRSCLLHRLLHSLPHLPLVPPRQRLPRQRIRAFRLCLRRFLHSRRQFPELLQPRILLGLYIEFVGCHWCSSDEACHAVGLMHGCAAGANCYSIGGWNRSGWSMGGLFRELLFGGWDRLRRGCWG